MRSRGSTASPPSPKGLAGLDNSPESIRLALLALLGIFIYGFFKFTWTLRQYNCCIAMIGAAPMPPIEAERHSRLADALARSIFEATLSFNAGLRCYYFGFATLAWFLHPLLVPVPTALTMMMLIRRQFFPKPRPTSPPCSPSTARRTCPIHTT